MANKRLSLPEIDEMKQMVVKGVYPEDIASHFGIAISSVHNYKKRFKDDGLKFPSVKGKRSATAPKIDSKGHTGTSPSVVREISTPGSNYKIIVNGVSIEISPLAKYVNIGKDSMEVKF